MTTSISSKAASSYKFLNEACLAKKAELDLQFKKKPLIERVGYYASEILRWGGLGVAVFSFGIGTLFSASFLLYGALGAMAFVVGVYARKYFETMTPFEDNLISSIKLLNFDKESVPSAEALTHIREAYLTDLVAEESNEKKDAFFKFFGQGQTLAEKQVDKNALVRMHQLEQVYATSLLLESIQYIATNQLELGKKKAEALAKMKLEIPETTLAIKLIKLPKDFHEKMQKTFEMQKTFKLTDLDTLYKIAQETE